MSGGEDLLARDPRTALLAEVTRRDQRDGTEVVESTHAGHLVVCGPDGAVVAALGDPERTTFARSAVKPLQAAACLEIVAERGDAEMTPSLSETAVAWSSHVASPTTSLPSRSCSPAPTPRPRP